MSDLGDTIEIYCKYCRRNLNGVIASIVDGKVAKVRCRTCGHFQDYKPPKDMAKEKERAMRRLMRSYNRKQAAQNRAEQQEAAKTPDQDTALRQLWEQETRDANFRNTKVYDVHRSYELGDFIGHKALGLGKVMEIVNDRKMKVLFRDRIEIISQAEPLDE